MRSIRTVEYYSALTKKELRQCENMDGPGGRCTKGNKPVTDGQILHDLTYTSMRNLQYSHHRSREKNGDCQGREDGEKGSCCSTGRACFSYGR